MTAKRLLRCMRLLLLLGTATFPAQAGLRLQATVEPQEARVGDPLHLKIEVTHPSDIKILPPGTDLSLSPFDVSKIQSEQPQPGNGEIRQIIDLNLTVFAVGVSTIPSFAVKYQTANGEVRELSTPEIPVLIKSVLTADSKDIREIKGSILMRNYRIWLWVLLSAGLLGAGIYIWMRYRIKKRTASAAPPRPPHEIALEQLAELGSALDGPAKLFYTRLAGILRVYVQGRYGLSTLDRTTSELFSEMKRRRIETDVNLAAKEVLEWSDIAKFAKGEPSEEERRRHIEQVRELVQRTRPLPPPTETVTAGFVPPAGPDGGGSA